ARPPPARRPRALDAITCPGSGRTSRSAAPYAAAVATANQVEADFYATYAAVERVRALFQPPRPDGTRWTDATVAAELAAINAVLAPLAGTLGRRVRTHVRPHGARFVAHRRALDEVEVERARQRLDVPRGHAGAGDTVWCEATGDDATRLMAARAGGA